MFIAQNGTVYPHQEMNVGITAGPTHVERMPDNEYRLTSTLAPVSTLTVNILRISRPMAFSNDPQLTPTNIKMHRIISFLDRHSENRWYKPIIPRVIRFFRRHRYKYQFKLQCSSVLCTNYLHQTNGGTEIFADRGSADDASIFIFEPRLTIDLNLL